MLCMLCAQHRGSLHAHILLWVEEADAERVKSEITATRCKYKLAESLAECPYVPDLPERGPDGAGSVAERLFLLVCDKQVHVCRRDANGCMHGRTDCRYGFPFDTNTAGTSFCSKTKRCAGRGRACWSRDGTTIC